MKEQSVSKGFAILSAANIFVKILSFLYIPFLLGILSDEGYGIYMAANNVYVFIYVLANSGLPSAISKLVAERVAEGNIKDALRSFKIARSYLLLAGIVLGALLAILAGPISYTIKYPQARLAIIGLAPALLFTSVASAYRGFFQGLGNMTPTAISQVIEQVINTVTTVLFAYLLINKGIDYACAGGTLGTSVSTLVSALYLIFVKSRSNFRNIVPPNINESVRKSYDYLSKKIIQYSIPLTLSIGLTYAGNLVDTWNIKSRLMAAGFTSENASILFGQLSKYQSLMNFPIALITSLSAAIFPALAGALAAKNHSLAQNRINYALKISLMISLPAAIGLSILSKPIYSFLKFGYGHELMQYGAAVLVLMSIMQIQNSILQSSGKLFQVVPNLFIGIVIKVISNYILIAIPSINIYGALIGSALGFAIPIILNHRIIKHSLKVKLTLKRSVISIFTATAAMAAAVELIYSVLLIILGSYSDKYLVTAIVLIATVGAGGLVYFISLVFTGGITEEDLRIVPSRFRKYIKIRKQI